MPARGQPEAALLQYVESDQPEVTDVFLHQVWNVIVADEENIKRHILANADQLVLAT
jgi:hypothetical protein